MGWFSKTRKAISDGIGKITSHFQFFSVLNAVANVFWSQQIRLPKLFPALTAQGVSGTLQVTAFFWLIDNFLHGFRFGYDKWFDVIFGQPNEVVAINATGSEGGLSERGNEKSALLSEQLSLSRQAFQEFDSWIPWLCDVLAAAGYTVRNANLPAFVLGYTLLNVYADQLGLDGGIRNDVNWKGYVTLSAIGGIGFFDRAYEMYRQGRAEKLMSKVLGDHPEFAASRKELGDLVKQKDFVSWMKEAEKSLVNADAEHRV